MFRRYLAIGVTLLLLAAQTASLSHLHAADTAAGGQSSVSCDFCTGLHAAAPPPVMAGTSDHASTLSPLPAADLLFAPPSRPNAHRTRAPPALHST